MDKILRGVLRYNAVGKSKFNAEIKRLGDSVKPHTVLVSCMDSRVFPSRFVDSSPGDIFIIRNAGNMIPRYRHYLEANMIGTEGAGFELSVVLMDVKNAVVCGHSDCKAMTTLYDLRHDCNYLKYKNESLLKTWITLHGYKSIETLTEVESTHSENTNGDYQPLVCSFNIGNQDVTAHIDPENNFGMSDKLSQLHCLQQASNFSTYPFLEERMKSGKLKVHAMWFDIHKGDVYFFSPSLERFSIVDESSLHYILDEVNS